jgi:hypothetical protein
MNTQVCMLSFPLRTKLKGAGETCKGIGPTRVSAVTG